MNKTINIINSYFNGLLNKNLNLLTDKEIDDILKYLQITEKTIFHEKELREFIKGLPNEKNT